MPYAERDGLRLYYEQAGSGDPPIVFVHGWCCDHTFFQPQFEYFQASHLVTTFDLRGCGKSSQTHDGYDMPSMADDLAWLCSEAGISRPVVVGHSWGGMIALELAARHPLLPAAFVAVDPGPISPTPQARAAHQALAAQMEGSDSEMARRNYIRNSITPYDDSDRCRQIEDIMCSVPQDIAVAAIRGVLDWNGLGALMLCKAPLLVLLAKTGGSNDPARLREFKPDVHVGVTVGSGHFNQIEVPEQVTPTIERFMQVAVTS